MPVYHSNAERRNDPELKEKLDRIFTEQNKRAADAAVKLRDIVEDLRPLTGLGDPYSVYDQIYDAVWSAAIRAEHDSDFLNRHAPNDCYLENMAAAKMGEYVQPLDVDKLIAIGKRK